MNLFLDTNVLLAACDSPGGGSRLIVDAAPLNGWTLFTSPYVIAEVYRNLHKVSPRATGEWRNIKPRLLPVADVLAIDKPVVFRITKDLPVLLTAHESAEVLLTLDRGDFHRLLGAQFYHLRIDDPRGFLKWRRAEGAVILP